MDHSKLITYLDDLPEIPENLLSQCYDPLISTLGFNDGSYYRWSVTDSLQQWLVDNICTVTQRMGCQTMEDTVPPHTDVRNWAINYIINTGGTVTTAFHRDPGKDLLAGPGQRRSFDSVEQIAEFCIEPRRWHLICTHVLHSVRGITGKREAITIGLITDKDPRSLLVNQRKV